MKAIRVHAPGGPEALRYEDVERPVPGPGYVLVKIEAAGLNFIDVYQRTGHYKVPVPFTLGQEAAGPPAALGPGVGEPRGGDPGAHTGILRADAGEAGPAAAPVGAPPAGGGGPPGGAAGV